MAEEPICQTPPEGHRLCVNNCGFFGSPATMNLCSKCFRDLGLEEQLQGTASIKSTISSSSVVSQVPIFDLPEIIGESSVLTEEIDVAAGQRLQQQQQPNRCMVCSKRVGLIGCSCKCGITFCGSHIYPENHGCTFDFKEVGKDEIARTNPVNQSREAPQNLRRKIFSSKF